MSTVRKWLAIGSVLMLCNVVAAAANCDLYCASEAKTTRHACCEKAKGHSSMAGKPCHSSKPIFEVKADLMSDGDADSQHLLTPDCRVEIGESVTYAKAFSASETLNKEKLEVHLPALNPDSAVRAFEGMREPIVSLRI